MNYAVVTGNFDGFHKGHQKLFRLLKEEAVQRNLIPLVLSFYPHTRCLVKGDCPVLLSTVQEKKIQLEKLFDLPLETIDFTEDFRKLTPFEFARRELFEKRKVRFWLMGENHTTGKGGVKLDTEALSGLEIKKVNLSCENKNVVSSTAIRKLLELGDWEKARCYLGHSYWLGGCVEHGDARGRTLGFPTANLYLNPKIKCLLPPGVYAGLTYIDGEAYPSVAHAGPLPSFDKGEKARLEIHILNFSDDLYGKEIFFAADQQLRGPVKFSNVNDLQKQIKEDIDQAKAYFAS